MSDTPTTDTRYGLAAMTPGRIIYEWIFRRKPDDLASVVRGIITPPAPGEQWAWQVRTGTGGYTVASGHARTRAAALVAILDYCETQSDWAKP